MTDDGLARQAYAEDRVERARLEGRAPHDCAAVWARDVRCELVKLAAKLTAVERVLGEAAEVAADRAAAKVPKPEKRRVRVKAEIPPSHFSVWSNREEPDEEAP